MKTHQLIQALTEHPEKEFVLSRNPDIHVFVGNRNVIFIGENENGSVVPFEIDVTSDDDWIERF